MDVILVAQYHGIWWKEYIREEQLSAAIAVHRMFSKTEVKSREVVSLSLASDPAQELV